MAKPDNKQNGPGQTPGVWMLTESFNDYNQNGPVPRCVWKDKPSIEQLADYFGHNSPGAYVSNVMGALAFLLRLRDHGGGRVGTEDSWHDLDFVAFGVKIGEDS